MAISRDLHDPSLLTPLSALLLLRYSSLGPSHLRGPDRVKRQRESCVARNEREGEEEHLQSKERERRDEYVTVSRTSKKLAGKKSEDEQEVLSVKHARIPRWRERRAAKTRKTQ